MAVQIFLGLDTACSDVELVTGSTTPPSKIATMAILLGICGNSCARDFGLSRWQVCGLHDGQLNGPGHGGMIVVRNIAWADSFDCWFECIQGTRTNTIF